MRLQFQLGRQIIFHLLLRANFLLPAAVWLLYNERNESFVSIRDRSYFLSLSICFFGLYIYRCITFSQFRLIPEIINIVKSVVNKLIFLCVLVSDRVRCAIYTYVYAISVVLHHFEFVTHTTNWKGYQMDIMYRRQSNMSYCGMFLIPLIYSMNVWRTQKLLLHPQITWSNA